jgi:hypothetical protein
VLACGVDQDGDGAYDVEGVFVVHGVAGGADSARLGVAVVGQAIDDGCATGFAVLDGWAWVHALSVLEARKKPPKRPFEACKPEG